MIFNFETKQNLDIQKMFLNKVIKKIATKFNHAKSDGKSFIVNIKKFERLFFKLSTTSSSLLRFILVNK